MKHNPYRAVSGGGPVAPRSHNALPYPGRSDLNRVRICRLY
jgi:hypothetical protein